MKKIRRIYGLYGPLRLSVILLMGGRVLQAQAVSPVPVRVAATLSESMNEGKSAPIRDALANGVDPNSEPDLLSWAVQFGNIPLIQQALEKGANPNVSARLQPPLFAAVMHNQKKAFDYLLQQSIDVAQRNQAGDTALDLAFKKGDAGFIAPLIQRLSVAEVLRAAVRTRQTEVLNRFAQQPAVVLSDPEKYHLWGQALEKAGTQELNLLLRIAPVHLDHIKNEKNEPALMIAFYAKQVDNFRWLLDQGADPETPRFKNSVPLKVMLHTEPHLNRNGKRPFISSLKEGEVIHPYVNALLAKGAALPALSFEQLLSLDQQIGPLPEALVRATLTPQNLQKRNAQGQSLLHQSVAHGSLGITQSLLAQGLDVNAQDAAGNTPVMLLFSGDPISDRLEQARVYGGAQYPSEQEVQACLALLDLLVKANGSLNIPNKAGQTFLHQAVAHWNVGAVQYALARGLPVNAQDQAGNTPLMLLFSVRHISEIVPTEALYGREKPPQEKEMEVSLSVFESLIKSRASLNTRNKAGETFLEKLTNAHAPPAYYPDKGIVGYFQADFIYRLSLRLLQLGAIPPKDTKALSDTLMAYQEFEKIDDFGEVFIGRNRRALLRELKRLNVKLKPGVYQLLTTPSVTERK